MHNQAKFFHVFNLCGHIGPASFKKLLIYFKSLDQAYAASLTQLKEAGLSEILATQIVTKRKYFDPDKSLAILKEKEIDLVTILDKNYPKLLKEIYNPPALLYIRGTLLEKDQFSLGIVGTRKLSPYGQQITPWLATDLAKAGLTIVSGLAKGIDTLAHQAALEAGGRTIAVLGCGVSDHVIYPAENRGLAKEIIKSGAVISEFPPHVTPRAQYFPQRNRIISGLSLGTLVIEAAERSGSLITANQALEQNRDVFAVPGPIRSLNSMGVNNLIKMGAQPITSAKDILQELNMNLITKKGEST